MGCIIILGGHINETSHHADERQPVAVRSKTGMFFLANKAGSLYTEIVIFDE
jgi:hypothetical protein